MRGIKENFEVDNECDDNIALPNADLESDISNEPLGKEKAERLDSRVDIHVISYRKRKHDPDGISAKYAIDGIVKRGILKDDSWDEIRKVTFESRKISKGEEEKTVIEIKDINYE